MTELTPQQSKIPGRTPLTEAQVLVIKSLDELHLQQMRGLEVLVGNQNVDQRALSLAITNTQQAHMWAVRAVAKPTF